MRIKLGALGGAALVAWTIAASSACAVSFPDFSPTTGSGGAATSGSTSSTSNGGGSASGGNGGSGGGGGGGGGSPCMTSQDCDDQEPCTTDTCGTDHTCHHAKLSDGKPVPGTVDIPNDCFREVCLGGVSTKVAVPGDNPDDLNDCTTDSCDGTTPKHKPLADGHSCGSGQQCHGGQCGCDDVSQCPASTLCITVTCEGTPQKVCVTRDVGMGIVVADQMPGDCHENECDGAGNLIAVPNVNDLPVDDNNPCTVECAADGTVHEPVPDHDPVPGFTQVPGDCQTQVCDGNGGQASDPDNADVPGSDGNACTLDTCMGGVPYPPAPINTMCSGGVCNATGKCVQCNSDGQCPFPPPSGHGRCVNNTCSCTPDTCAGLQLTCSATSNGCGGMIACSDGLQDGAETDVDCGGNTAPGGPHCPTRCASGRNCHVGSDCVSGTCNAGLCF